ncbi:MAG: enoyl-CoA hydratase/isomerase family protein, partial [Vulcanimicrobiaceae bacterium]
MPIRPSCVGDFASLRMKRFAMSEKPNTDHAPPIVVDRSDAVVRVTLSRLRSANALDGSMVDALLGVLDRSRDSPVAGSRALVIAGDGNNFCGGFDLSDIASLSEGEIILRFLRIESLLQRLYHAPFLTIACAQGNAVGAGAD